MCWIAPFWGDPVKGEANDKQDEGSEVVRGKEREVQARVQSIDSFIKQHKKCNTEDEAKW